MAYKDYEKRYLDTLKTKYKSAEIVYTEYEDSLIRKVRGIKYIGSILQHILYWIKSLNYARKVMKMEPADIICINPIVGVFLGLMNKKINLMSHFVDSFLNLRKIKCTIPCEKK